jgi:hypothetical protein
MKKVLLVALCVGSSFGSEFQFGAGTFTMEGGFLGLTNSIDNDVVTYSVGTRHSNFGKNFFYGYDLTWYDSKDLIQAQQTYNNLARGFQIPEMEYRVKGLDANIRVGYDVLHQDQDNYLGVGVLVGISTPWIDTTKSDNTAPSLNSFSSNFRGMVNAKDLFDKSETDVLTYKLGATLSFSHSLISNKLSIYGVTSYAYQTGTIENDYAKSDFDVDGTFQEYNIGFYFTPFTTTFKWGFLTLSPRIYATLGYRYSKWSVDKMVIDISGANFDSNTLAPFEKEFEMSSSIGYFGVGYSF